MTKYMSEYLIPYEHNSQEHLFEHVMDKRLNISISNIREMMLEKPHKDWPFILDIVETNKSIYKLLRYALGKAILGVGEGYEVHPSEDLFMEVEEEEGPMQFYNCPEATFLLSFKDTLEYILKHETSEMVIEGDIKEMEFWWEENPLGVIWISKDYYEDMRYNY